MMTIINSGEAAQDRKNFNLGTGEIMYRVNGTYIFERDNYDNRAHDYYWYNSKNKPGKKWERFEPYVYTRPKLPRNMLKLIFFDAIIEPFNPVEDVDVYVSASVKAKSGMTKINGMDVTVTTPMIGFQVGVTTKDNQVFYTDVITPANAASYSYGSIKKGITEYRGIPLNTMYNIPMGGSPARYGDFTPQLRVLNDFGVYRGVTIQGELGVSTNNLTLGIRGKKEFDTGVGLTFEAVGGVRASLKPPSLFKAIWKQL